MISIVLRGLIFLGLVFARVETLNGQSFSAGFGVGPTLVLDESRGNRNWTGVLGYQGRGPFGVRVSGAETAERLWLSADLTYRFTVGAGAMRPYALVGLGYVLDLAEDDPLVTAGAGLRAQIHRVAFLFAEARLQRIVGIPDEGPATLLPLTFGLGVGH